MHCIVVRRGDFQTYDLLYKTFGSRLPVIWDRRKQTSEGGAADAERNRRATATPASWVALGFVVADYDV